MKKVLASERIRIRVLRARKAFSNSSADGT